jgi:2-dehydropantoate 2-reductase
MQIIVLGAGAIGSLYGSKLAAANDVILLARPEHAQAINTSSLRVEGLESHAITVRAVTQVQTMEPNALVLVTTKVTDTGAVLKPIAPLVRDDTTIVLLQNGLNIEEIAQRTLGNRAVVLRAVTQFGAIFTAPGAIQFLARGHTVIEQHERSDEIARVFTAAGLDCRVSPDIRHDVWYKLIVNCVVNPITAILGCEVGGIANPELDPLKELIIAECLAVAAAEGFEFKVDFNREISDFFRPSHNRSSMLQDLRRGRTTEIDYLNGAVAELAQRHGIPCPMNSALTTIIKAMVAKTANPQRS